MTRPYDLLIFDMDGTLYPYNQEIDKAYPEAAFELAARVSGKNSEAVRDEFYKRKSELGRKIGGRPTYTLTLLYFYPVTVEEFEKAVDSRLNVENLLEPDSKVIEVLKKVSSEYQLALYTTNNGRTADRILKTIGVDSFFPLESRLTLSSITSLARGRDDLVNYIKPGRKGFLYLLEKFNCRPERTLMIGDSEVSDIRPAEELGLDTYHVKTREDFYNLPDWLGIDKCQEG